MKEYMNERFEGLSLIGDELCDMVFDECEFVGCTVEGCTLEYCEFNDCIFTGCRLIGNKTDHSTMSLSVFKDCTIVNVSWQLWKPSNLLAQPFDSFEHCELRFCSFNDYNMSRFRFAGCGVNESVFSDCKLQKADFNGCDLTGTEFIRCDMRSADLRNAENYRIGIFTCDLKGARFSASEALLLLGELGIKLE